MLDQKMAVATRKIPSFVRLQVNVSRRVISDLRQKKFLGKNEVSKEAIGRALMSAAVAGIKTAQGASIAKKLASIGDCAKSLAFLRPLKDGGYISESDHDRIVGRVRRDLAKNGGVAGLEREGRLKRMAGGYVPDFHIPAPQAKHANNENYGMYDEESLNWHQQAGYSRHAPRRRP